MLNGEPGDMINDSVAVCRAYLSEHPADDDEPATQEWIGDAADWREVDAHKKALLTICGLKTITKGLFRRLARELGVPLKENK